MNFLEEAKKWLGEITEISLLLIALAIALEILFGGDGRTVPFFGGVVTHLTELLSTLGDNGLAGLIALGIILFLFRRKSFAQQHQHHG